MSEVKPREQEISTHSSNEPKEKKITLSVKTNTRTFLINRQFQQYRMWNQIACNRLVEHKTHLKAHFSFNQEQARLQKQLTSTKGSFCMLKAQQTVFPSRSNQYKNERSAEINRENFQLVKRLRSIKTIRPDSHLSKTTEKSKALSQSKERMLGRKKILIEEENHRLLKRLLNTSSSLKKFRIKTCQNSQEKIKVPSQKVKPIMFMSGSSQGLKSRPRKMVTEGVKEVESRIQDYCIEESIEKGQEVLQQEIQVE